MDLLSFPFSLSFRSLSSETVTEMTIKRERERELLTFLYDQSLSLSLWQTISITPRLSSLLFSPLSLSASLSTHSFSRLAIALLLSPTNTFLLLLLLLLMRQAEDRKRMAPLYAAYSASITGQPSLLAVVEGSDDRHTAERMRLLFKSADADSDQRLMLDELVAFLCAAVDDVASELETEADQRYDDAFNGKKIKGWAREIKK
jgi:hypothetical protein